MHSGKQACLLLGQRKRLDTALSIWLSIVLSACATSVEIEYFVSLLFANASFDLRHTLYSE